MFKSIFGARAARVALLLCGLAAFGLCALQLGRDQIQPAMSDNTVTIGCIWRASPITLSIDKSTAGVNCDTNGNMQVTVVGGSLSATIALPFTGGATGVAPAAGQSIGIQAYNGSTGQMDAVQLDASDNLKTFDTLGPGPSSGANVIGTVILQPWTPTIESGNNPSGPFGSTVCPSGSCGVLVKSGAGVVGTLQWNSLTGLGAITLTCWKGTSAGTIDTQLFQASNMTAGEMWPIPPGGFSFPAGMWCATSGFISTTQAFIFGIH